MKPGNLIIFFHCLETKMNQTLLVLLLVNLASTVWMVEVLYNDSDTVAKRAIRLFAAITIFGVTFASLHHYGVATFFSRLVLFIGALLWAVESVVRNPGWTLAKRGINLFGAILLLLVSLRGLYLALL